MKQQLTLRQIVILLATAIFAFVPAAYARTAKNVILMISDGAGFNTYQACSYYQYGRLGDGPYEQAGFVRYGCTHYSLNDDGTPLGYDPAKMWSDPAYAKAAATDSAAAATALNTGVKTLNGRIDMDRLGQSLTSFAQIADRNGKSTGAVTTVQLSDATPACVWAHNLSRDNHAAIANEIFASGLDVIMGAGNPEYNNNGQPEKMSSQFVGGNETWNALKSGKFDTNDTNVKTWTLIQSKNEFEALASKTVLPPGRVIGVPMVNASLQYYRTGTGMAAVNSFNANVPTLETMAVAALNVVAQNKNGFYLMIEGGAVDRANHGNNLGRMLEEMTDFNRAAAAVVRWVEANSSWDETLVIVTSDHETGMLWGPRVFDYIDANNNGVFDPGVDTFTGFNPVVNNGRAAQPGVQYGYGSHTNALVPLFARGPGSELFAGLVDGVDTQAGKIWQFSGQYVDNTDVFTVMNQAILSHSEATAHFSAETGGASSKK